MSRQNTVLYGTRGSMVWYHTTVTSCSLVGGMMMTKCRRAVQSLPAREIDPPKGLLWCVVPSKKIGVAVPIRLTDSGPAYINVTTCRRGGRAYCMYSTYINRAVRGIFTFLNTILIHEKLPY